VLEKPLPKGPLWTYAAPMRLLFPCLLSFGLASCTFADWPQYMPKGVMKSPEKGLLKSFPESGLKTLWTHEIGEGYSGPIIAGGKAFAFHRVEDQETLDCLDATTGKQLWRQQYKTTYEDRYGFNGGPRSMPAVSDQLVFTHGVQGILTARDVETGTQKWQRDLNTDYKILDNFFGVGTSPIVHKDQVFINVGADGGPEVISVDAKTGKTLWSVDNPDNWGPSYSTPIVATIDEREKLLVFAGGDRRPAVGGLLQIDLERKAIDFRFPWRCERYESVNASAPLVVDGNKIFVSWSILGGEGALCDQKGKQVWKTDKLGAYWMTPLLKDGHIYGIHGEKTRGSDIVCLHAKTGKQTWRTMPEFKETVKVGGGERDLTLALGRGWLLDVDDAVLALGEYGHLVWLELSPKECKVLDETWLFAAQETWSPPVVVDGRLYVAQHTPGMLGREPTRLHCFDLKAANYAN